MPDGDVNRQASDRLEGARTAYDANKHFATLSSAVGVIAITFYTEVLGTNLQGEGFLFVALIFFGLSIIASGLMMIAISRRIASGCYRTRGPFGGFGVIGTPEQTWTGLTTTYASFILFYLGVLLFAFIVMVNYPEIMKNIPRS